MAGSPRITIIGTGFVGTSLGLALQRVRNAQTPFELVGHDKNASAAQAAKKRGAIDKAEWNLISSVEGADLIFLAIPVQAVKETMDFIGSHLKPGTIVTDTAGAKSQVMRWATQSLPTTINFIGGDPMLGREGTPVDQASADVFAKSAYCLIPAPNADGEAVRILSNFISAIGASPYFIDPDEHDGVAAGVAHLPYFAALALTNVAAHSPASAELQKMMGANFRELTAMVGADPASWEGVAATNSPALLRWIDSLVAELQAVRRVVEQGDAEQIGQVFGAARDAQLKLTRATQDESSPMDDVGKDRMRQMLFGSWGSKKK